jgi:membrane-associated protein
MLDATDGLLSALSGLHPALLLALTALFNTLETSLFVGLIVPGDSVVLLAGTTVTGPGRFAALVAASTLGSLLGESIGYWVGNRHGDRLRRRLGEDAWTKAEAFFEGRRGGAVAAARFVAVVHAFVPLVAGAAGMRYRRFIGWSAAGALAWSLLYVSVGAAAGASWRQFGERLGLSGLAVLAVLLGTAWLVRRARRHRPAATRPGSPPGGGHPPLVGVACRAGEPAAIDRQPGRGG